MTRGACLLAIVLLAAPAASAQTVKNGVGYVGLKTPDNPPQDVGTVTRPLYVAALPPGPLLPASVITSAMTGTTSTQVVAAIPGSFLYITSCNFANDHATVDTLMRLQDGSGGTTIWQGMVPHGGGNAPSWPTPKKVPTRGNALFVVNVTTGSSTYASCDGWSSTTSY